jgi:hypothetical protein
MAIRINNNTYKDKILKLSYIAYHIHGIIDLKFMIGGLAGVICTLMMVYLDN